MNTSVIEGALFWAEQGVPVFPCGANKAPLTENGFYDATTDPIKVKELFEFFGNQTVMVGARMGEESGLFAMDFDLYKGDEPKEYMENLMRDGCLPDSRIHETRSGGLHVLYRSDTDWPNLKPCAGVEVKGEGGYIIVPPSDGYVVVREGLEEAPEALLRALQIARDVSSSASIDQLKKAVREASDFHDSLRGIAAKLSARGVSPEDVLTELFTVLEASVASRPQHKRHDRWSKLMGDHEHELSRIVESGYQKYNANAKAEAYRDAFQEQWAQTAEEAGFKPNPPEGETYEEPVYDPNVNPFEGEGFFAHEQRDILDQEFIMHPLFAEGETTVLFAEPKKGKTAWNVTAGFHIACGRNFGDGLLVPQKKAVLYFALEGVRAIELRIEALKLEMAEQGVELPEKIPFFVQERPLNLMDAKVRADLCAKIVAFDKYCVKEYGCNLGVVSLDTLTKAMSQGDQNSASDTAALFEINNMLRSHGLQCNITYVHHKARTGGVRGSTNIEAEPDVLLDVEKDKDALTVSIPRARSIEEGGQYTFKIKSWDLGENKQGIMQKSFVVLPDTAIPADMPDIGLAQEDAKALNMILSLGNGRHTINIVLRTLGAANLGPKNSKGKTISPAQGKRSVEAQEWFQRVIGKKGRVYKEHALSLDLQEGSTLGVIVTALAS